MRIAQDQAYDDIVGMDNAMKRIGFGAVCRHPIEAAAPVTDRFVFAIDSRGERRCSILH